MKAVRPPGTATQDPLAVLRALPTLANPSGTTLLVLVNFHRFLQSVELVQTLIHQLNAGKQTRTFVLILSPIVQIPIELEKLFLVIEHDLPTRDQLLDVARGIAAEPGELPSGPQLDAVLDAATGLTRFEAESAFSLSLVRHGRLATDVLWELKGSTLKKNGLLQLHRGDEAFDQLGGLDSLKAFCRRALRSGISTWNSSISTASKLCLTTSRGLARRSKPLAVSPRCWIFH